MFPLLLLSAFIGVAIGLTGIGGILAIPALIALAELPRAWPWAQCWHRCF